MGVTEADAAKALPSNGLVRSYVEWAARQTTAPLIYHLASILPVLATTCPPEYTSLYAGRLPANLYVMLAGTSGDAMKSTAVRLAHDLLFAAAPTLVGAPPASDVALVEALVRQPSQLLVYSEMGELLSRAKITYFEPVKAMLAHVYDGGPVQRPRRVVSKPQGGGGKKGRAGSEEPPPRAESHMEVVRCNTPRLSVLAGCSLAYLQRYTDIWDWQGGFFGRFLFFHAERERSDPDPACDYGPPELFVRALQARAATPRAGPFAGLTPLARRVWNMWFRQNEMLELPPLVAGVRVRAPALARKIAMLYAWDFGGSWSGEPWQMDLDVLAPAIRLVQLYLQSIVSLSDQLARHDDARQQQLVLSAFTREGASLTLRDILLHTRQSRKRAMEALDALVEMGKLRSDGLGGATAYSPVVESKGDAVGGTLDNGNGLSHATSVAGVAGTLDPWYAGTSGGSALSGSSSEE